MTSEKFFSLGMLFFINYVQRRRKENPEYLPTSLVRAFMVAFEAASSIEVGQTALGTAFDKEKGSNNVQAGYAIVLTKMADGFEILEIRDLVNDVTLPSHFALVIFNLQMILDRIEGGLVHASFAVDALNESFERPKFVALLDQWPIARDNFVARLKEGKVAFPPMPKEEADRMKAAMSSITAKTKWEDYPQSLRSHIASFLIADKEGENLDGSVVISTTHDHMMKKLGVIRIAIEMGLKLEEHMKPKYR